MSEIIRLDEPTTRALLNGHHWDKSKLVDAFYQDDQGIAECCKIANIKLPKVAVNQEPETKICCVCMEFYDDDVSWNFRNHCYHNLKR